MKALHLMIHGRVQGVWFRASTQEAAERLGVHGWVRNTPDGEVETHIQGKDASVDDLLAWCHQGPPGARVDRIDVREVKPEAEHKAFSIRYY
jgi:acylphosphatase